MVIFAIVISKKVVMKEVVIVSVARTPIGSFMGSLASIPATELGAVAIKGALEKIQLDPNLVDEVYMGNVVSAGLGQAPARQAAISAGIPNTVPCTTVNKVCSSGMKSIMLAAQAIAIGDADVVVAGGMENMSQIPHYQHARNGNKFGPITLEDGLQKDGLVDAYDKVAWEFAQTNAPLNMDFLEKHKMPMQFSLTNALLRLGKQENLQRKLFP